MSRIKVSRRDKFSLKSETAIWQEFPSEDNPYIAEHSRCYGYELSDLVKNVSFVEMLVLLLRGELPTSKDLALLNGLMVGLSNPGPRHPATRAAMSAGVGKTDVVDILPIGLTILGGDFLGAGEVYKSMEWLSENIDRDPASAFEQSVSAFAENSEGDFTLFPGFGSYYGGIDEQIQALANQLICLDANKRPYLDWCCNFVAHANKKQMGWRATGLAAAVFCDVDISSRAGCGLFQILSAPGLLAHGVEMLGKPLNSMPFPEDSDYIIE